MTILTLNCQKGYHHGLHGFMQRLARESTYDVILLQEVSDNVTAMIAMADGPYELLRLHNPAVRSPAQTAILYRSRFRLMESQFRPVTQVVPSRHPRGEFGMTVATLATPEFPSGLLVASVHAHSNLHFRWRAREIRYFKDRILSMRSAPAIIGGDFNSGLPWEVARNEQIMSPEFCNATFESGPTCESRFVEPSTPLNRLALFGADAFGINLSLVVDHIFVSTALRSALRPCKVLPDRVSDHSALSVELQTTDVSLAA